MDKKKLENNSKNKDYNNTEGLRRTVSQARSKADKGPEL